MPEPSSDPSALPPEVPESAAMPHPELAGAVTACIPELRRRWLEQARAALPEMRKMSDEEVLDDLPKLIAAIAGALSEPVAGHRELSATGGIHGLTRFHQRLTIDDLGTEYPLLRQVMMQGVRGSLRRPMTEQEADALHGALDRIIHLSNAAYAQLQEKEIRLESEATSRHLAMISHDLRNTLNAAMLSIQYISERLRALSGQTQQLPDLPELLRDLDDCRRMTMSGVETMKRVLDAERLTPAAVSINIQPVDLFALLRGVRTAAARADGSSDSADTSQVELDCPEGLTVRTDADLVSTILQNLLGNAIRYGGDAPIRLAARRSDDGACRIDVIDQGPGIAPEQLETIFAPFRRGDHKPASGGSAGGGIGGESGMGLGLFIARRAADLLRAKLEVASTPGEGATFSLLLPPPRPVNDEA